MAFNRITAVQVEILNPLPHTEFRRGHEPGVYFGTFMFRYLDDWFGHQEFINSARAIFFPQSWATGFAVNYRPGVIYRARAVYDDPAQTVLEYAGNSTNLLGVVGGARPGTDPRNLSFNAFGNIPAKPGQFLPPPSP